MYVNGLVIDIGRFTVTVMTPDNAFYRLQRKSHMYLSQEIDFKQSDIINAQFLTKRLAAACIFFVFGFLLYLGMGRMAETGSSKEYARFSLDMNQSIEISVDRNENVLDATDINPDADGLTSGISLKGLKLDSAVTGVIERLKDKGMVDSGGKACLLISGSVNTGNRDVKGDKKYADYRLAEMLEGIKSCIENTSAVDNEIVVLKARPEDGKLARENNISIGRYAMYSEIKRLGGNISLKEAKNTSINLLVEAYTEAKVQKSSGQLPTPVAEVSGALREDSGSQDNPALSGRTVTPTFPDSVLQTPEATAEGAGSQALPDATPILPAADTLAGSSVAQTPSPSAASIESGTGLKGEYFDNLDLTNLKLTRIDSKINFFWGVGVPDKAIRNDEAFSVRWTGEIEPEFSEEYTFYVTRDNGVRLWIGNKLLIDKWNNEYNVTNSAKISLSCGKKYPIRIDYNNNSGNALIKLEWSSKNTKKDTVPQKCLYPAAASVQPKENVEGDGTGLKCQYYDNTNLTDLKYTGVDPQVFFNWGVSSPDKAITMDQKYSIRWTGQIKPLYSEEYVFYITGDGGVRLWIDGKPIIDSWSDKSLVTLKSKVITLEADKKYSIKLEYYNGGVNGSVKLEWSSNSTKRSVVPASRLYP